jgi:hypothetical protein
MKIRSTLGVLVALSAVAAPQSGEGQGRVEKDLAGLAAENAHLYVEPLARGLALAMGAGTFDGAASLPTLGFELGAKVTGAILPAEADGFAAVAPETVTWTGPFGGTFEDPYRPVDGSLSTPTVAGEGPGVTLEPDGEFRDAIMASGLDPSDFALVFPEGEDVPLVPHPVLYAGLGIGLGTEVSVRYTPTLEVDDEIGEVKGLGFAVRHTLSQWFPSPIDIAVQAATQEVKLGPYADARSTEYGLLASRRMGPLSIFAAGVMRRGEVDVEYTAENPGDDNPGLPADGTRISFSEDLDSDTTFGLGARLQLLVLNLAGEYTWDEYPLVTVKVGFGSP